MKRMLYIMLILAAAVCSCGGSKEPAPTSQESVSVNPSELSCAASATVLTLNVTASAAFQAYAEDGIEWVTVTPSYSAEKSAAVTVSVADNVAYQARETYVTIVRNSVEPRLERAFFTALVQMGFHVKIESNDRS